MKTRKVSNVVLSVEQSEGVGARVRRSIGRKEVGLFRLHRRGSSSHLVFKTETICVGCFFFSQLRNLDPFLLLDEFCVRKPAGFPDHPHRGFETVSSSSDHD